MVREINLNHICKIEGHASLNLKIEKNKVKVCELKAEEGARFFEALVLGRKIEDVQEIVSRICGICSNAHTVASIQALEKALNIQPTEQQKLIREILTIAERIRSHATHLYFLSLPDYYNFPSALEMQKKYPNKINDALKLISTGNQILEIFGGREIHPFLDIQENIPQTNFQSLIQKLDNSLQLIKQTISLFSNIKNPKLERKIDYLCLRDKEYATISGTIKSNSGKFDVEEYKDHLTENIKEYATSKFALKEEKSFQVGAIARINNNRDQLDSESKQYLKKLKFPLNNPFENNLCQAIELLHLTKQCKKIIEKLKKIKPEKRKKIKICEGHGISAIEAPRGTLFHEYKIDNHGCISYCNIITPTVQNLFQMEKDIILLVEQSLNQKKSKKQIIDLIEKLIRAYDPCFSCSTHFLKVKWNQKN